MKTKRRTQHAECSNKTMPAMAIWFGLSLALCGCGDNHASTTAAPSSPPATLVSANQALSAHMPDMAIADTQDYLRGNANGPYAADALYIQGSAYQQKTAGSAAEVQRNLFQSRSSFLEALQQSPPLALEGNIRASLSNITYFQDDFPESIRQATAAMKLVSSSDVKGSLLFRIGAAQQRLQRFTDADQTFRLVEQRYPNTSLAEAAREHEGMTNFYVQVASFSNRAAADQAMAALRGNGINVSQRTDNKGLTILDDGPFGEYAEAKKAKENLQANFPQAMIVP